MDFHETLQRVHLSSLSSFPAHPILLDCILTVFQRTSAALRAAAIHESSPPEWNGQSLPDKFPWLFPVFFCSTLMQQASMQQKIIHVCFPLGHRLFFAVPTTTLESVLLSHFLHFLHIPVLEEKAFPAHKLPAVPYAVFESKKLHPMNKFVPILIPYEALMRQLHTIAHVVLPVSHSLSCSQERYDESQSLYFLRYSAMQHIFDCVFLIGLPAVLAALYFCFSTFRYS